MTLGIWSCDDSDGAYLTSFGIEFQTEEEAKENERSPSVALLCAGLLRRGMVYELERVLRVCNGFLCSMSVTYKIAAMRVIPELRRKLPPVQLGVGVSGGCEAAAHAVRAFVQSSVVPENNVLVKLDIKMRSIL